MSVLKLIVKTQILLRQTIKPVFSVTVRGYKIFFGFHFLKNVSLDQAHHSLSFSLGFCSGSILDNILKCCCKQTGKNLKSGLALLLILSAGAAVGKLRLIQFGKYDIIWNSSLNISSRGNFLLHPPTQNEITPYIC